MTVLAAKAERVLAGRKLTVSAQVFRGVESFSNCRGSNPGYHGLILVEVRLPVSQHRREFQSRCHYWETA